MTATGTVLLLAGCVVLPAACKRDSREGTPAATARVEVGAAPYRLFIAYVPEGYEASEDWGFFFGDVHQAVTPAGVVTVHADAGVDEVVAMRGGKEVGRVDLRPFRAAAELGYVVAEEGRAPLAVAYGVPDETLEAASRYFGLALSPAVTVTWTSLTAGENHTCGLRGGVAYCWGYNGEGQLGDGSTDSSTTPVAVAGGFTFASLTAGGSHTCSLTSGGAAYCWGKNSRGQLGDGPITGRTTPMAVAGGITFASLTAGDYHTCGLTRGGAAYCWGDNSYGELGDGSTTDRTTPGAVAGGITFASLTAGEAHTCGLTSGGAAYCWGSFEWLPEGGEASAYHLGSSPVAVQGGITFASLTAGGGHTCGLTIRVTAYCWGVNTYGEDEEFEPTPVAVVAGTTFASLTAGAAHTCSLTSIGDAYCWGINGYGQLGDGSTTERTTPVAVAGGIMFASLTAGGTHTCGLASRGAAYCWGNNNAGQLGDGSKTSRTTPVAVAEPLTPRRGEMTATGTVLLLADCVVPAAACKRDSREDTRAAADSVQGPIAPISSLPDDSSGLLLAEP